MSRRKQYRPIRLPEDDDDEDDNGGKVPATVATKDALSATPSEGVTNDDQLIINGNANDYSLAEEKNIHPPTKVKNHLLTQDVENNNSNQSVDENGPKSPDPGQNHVTLGMLENTKVAVAQFTPTTSPPDKEKALQELAMLQTTLFSLQHQQVFQMQLIKQLQLQLAENDEDDVLSMNKDPLQSQQQQPPPPPLVQRNDDNDVARDELITSQSNNNAMNSEQTSFATAQHIDGSNNSELHAKETENQIINSLKKETSTRSQSSSRCESPMRDYETEINRIQQTANIRVSPTNSASSMCQISSSLASTIITHDNNYPEPGELNSLEMLQKTAQESLESASSGLLAGNLADELAFRREKSYAEGKNGKEALFKHRCRYCGKVFGSDSALQIHLRSHTGERPFKCNVCSSKFTTKGNLKVHYQRHTQRFPNIPLGHIPIPPEHLDKYHPALLAKLGNAVLPPAPSSPLPITAPVYRPPLEHFQPKSPDDESEAKDLRKPMAESDTESDDYPGKRRKMSEASNVTPMDSNDEVSNDNPILDEPENLSTLALHKPRTPSPNERRSKRLMMMAAATKPPQFATLPPRPRSNDHSWENYIEIRKPSETETSKLQQLVDNIEHELTDPNQCLICHRILSCRSSLQMHYRIHTGERPFRCRLCGRSFTTKGNLKVHMSIHRLLPPMRSQHQCPVCHKKFLNGSVLQQHIRLHTGEHVELTTEQIAAAEIQDFTSPPEQPKIDEYENYKSEEDGGEETRSRSPSPLDLTPRFKASPLRTKSQPSGHHPFRNFPIPPIHPASAFLARSLSLPTPPTPPPPQHRDFPQHFNPLNLAGVAGKGTTTCSICLKTFACHSALETHYRSHTKQKPFKCSLCNRSFSTKGNMKQHMQGHKSSLGAASQPDANDNSSLSSLDSQTTAATAASVLDENSRYESVTIKHNRSANQSPDVLNLTRKSKKTTNDMRDTIAGSGGSSPERRTSTSGSLLVDNPSILSDNDTSSTYNIQSSSPQQRHNFNLSPQRHQRRPDDTNSPDVEKLADLVVTVDYDRHLKMEQQNRHIAKRQQHGAKPNHKQMENFVFHQSEQRTQQHISRFDNNDRQNRPDEHETDENDGEPSPLQILSPMAQLIFSQKQQQHQQQQQQHHHQQSPLENILRPQQMAQQRQHEPNSLSLLSTLAESSNSYPNNGKNTNQTATTATVLPPPPPPPSTSPLCNANVSPITSSTSSTATSSSIVNNKLGIGDAKPITTTAATRIDTSPSIATTPFDATNHVNSKHLCKVCRKNFSSSSALQIHFRTHTGDKPFRCQTCQKAFTTKGNLKVHMGIHMWTNSASRRGRRMSLELPLNRPHSMVHPESPDFAARRPDWFYPYIPPPPFLNGMPPKLPDMGNLPKYTSLMGFGPNFLHAGGIRPLQPRPPSPTPSLNSDRSSTETTSPPPNIIMRSPPIDLKSIKTEIDDTDGLNLSVGSRNNEVTV